MIQDSDTNFLYLSDCLPKKQPDFFQRLEKVLNNCNISFQFLQDTKDIWAVDFMPVQISKDKFIQFTYYPDYLQPKKYQKSISDTDRICKAINLMPKKSKLVVDGGNVIRTKSKVIMCDKVFKENPDITEKELIRQLKDDFEIDNLFFVTWDKSDFTGHADGMVRFADNNTVLINDYSKEKPEYQRAFRMALHNAGLDWIELPYNPYENESNVNAEGTYLNYLQMSQAVIVPTFKSKEDDEAVRILEQVFKGQRIETVDSNEVAREGGILNCVTWNILKE